MEFSLPKPKLKPRSKPKTRSKPYLLYCCGESLKVHFNYCPICAKPIDEIRKEKKAISKDVISVFIPTNQIPHFVPTSANPFVPTIPLLSPSPKMILENKKEITKKKISGRSKLISK